MRAPSRAVLPRRLAGDREKTNLGLQEQRLMWLTSRYLMAQQCLS
jgi:hypothetical protein